jgi:hypothetical protein
LNVTTTRTAEDPPPLALNNTRTLALNRRFAFKLDRAFPVKASVTVTLPAFPTVLLAVFKPAPETMSWPFAGTTTLKLPPGPAIALVLETTTFDLLDVDTEPERFPGPLNVTDPATGRPGGAPASP